MSPELKVSHARGNNSFGFNVFQNEFARCDCDPGLTRLVYGTCSILREENEGIVDAFLADAGFTKLSAAQILGREDVGGEVLRLSPVTHGCDGFFACAMERNSA